MWSIRSVLISTFRPNLTPRGAAFAPTRVRCEIGHPPIIRTWRPIREENRAERSRSVFAASQTKDKAGGGGGDQ